MQVILNTQLREHLTALDAILGADLAAFNATLRGKNIQNVVGGPRIVP